MGDNVGDVAGMGADLFGSFGEATCAALVIAAQSRDLVAAGWDALMFPMYISGAGIVVCMVGHPNSMPCSPTANRTRVLHSPTPTPLTSRGALITPVNLSSMALQ